MGDAHIVVIHDHCQHVGGRAVRAQQHEIVEGLVLPHHTALHPVLDHSLPGERRSQTDHRLDAGGRLGGIPVAPAPVIEPGAALAPRFLTHLIEFPLGRVAAIGLPGGKQLLRHLAVAVSARVLIDHRAVPGDAEPREPVENGVNRLLRGAFAVGVLDPQQHLTAASARVEPVEKRGPRPADVQEAGGRRSEACDDGSAHVGKQISQQLAWFWTLVSDSRSAPVQGRAAPVTALLHSEADVFTCGDHGRHSKIGPLRLLRVGVRTQGSGLEEGRLRPP